MILQIDSEIVGSVRNPKRVKQYLMLELELIDEFVSDKQKKPLPKSLLFQGPFLENLNHVQAMDQK